MCMTRQHLIQNQINKRKNRFKNFLNNLFIIIQCVLTLQVLSNEERITKAQVDKLFAINSHLKDLLQTLGPEKEEHSQTKGSGALISTILRNIFFFKTKYNDLYFFMFMVQAHSLDYRENR